MLNSCFTPTKYPCWVLPQQPHGISLSYIIISFFKWITLQHCATYLIYQEAPSEIITAPLTPWHHHFGTGELRPVTLRQLLLDPLRDAHGWWRGHCEQHMSQTPTRKRRKQVFSSCNLSLSWTQSSFSKQFFCCVSAVAPTQSNEARSAAVFRDLQYKVHWRELCWTSVTHWYQPSRTGVSPRVNQAVHQQWRH